MRTAISVKGSEILHALRQYKEFVKSGAYKIYVSERGEVQCRKDAQYAGWFVAADVYTTNLKPLAKRFADRYKIDLHIVGRMSPNTVYERNVGHGVFFKHEGRVFVKAGGDRQVFEVIGGRLHVVTHPPLAQAPETKVEIVEVEEV